MKKTRLLAIFLTVILTIGILDVFAGTAKTDVAEKNAVTPQLSQKDLDRIYDPRNYENEFMPGEVIVGLKARNMRSEPRALFSGLDIAEIEDLYEPLVAPFEPSGGATREMVASVNKERLSALREQVGTVYVITLSSKTRGSVLEAIEVLKKNPYVSYAEPNYISYPAAVPNDPEYSRLWGLEKIQAPLAWDITTGSHSVRVGVLDTGVDYNHPDLVDNIDPFLSYNARLDSYDKADSMDLSGHGTHVAGTVGAVGNNSIGLVGVNWNVSIVPINIAISSTSGSTNGTLRAAAVRMATLHDLPIITMSYKISSSQTFNNAVRDYDGLLIIAANNDNVNLDTNSTYTSAHALGNVIFVAATISNDRKHSDSSYGVNTVDIAAPGNIIYSTERNNRYGNRSGTSMAAPHVASAAALLLSANPNLTTEELKAALLDNADIIPALDGFVNGSRRLNVYRAIQSVISEILLSVNDLSYNGAVLTFNSINVSETGAFWKNKTLYIEIKKSDNPTPIALGNVTLDSTGNATFTLPTTAQLNSDEHIEVLAYISSAAEKPLTRLAVYPTAFGFNLAKSEE
ncbi:MAG: S8 family serine peptidase [Defluviitaleaceae bacterium]|nr:S8 family serine peptidase [Defluviitaleaceae bacterium]